MLALVPALMLASMTARAEPVGNLRTVSASASRDGVQGWDLQTDKGARIRIELPATDIIRVQAGRNGTLTGARQGRADRAAAQGERAGAAGRRRTGNPRAYRGTGTACTAAAAAPAPGTAGQWPAHRAVAGTATAGPGCHAERAGAVLAGR